MKKISHPISTQDQAKPFVVAIGIAFTFLALVVLYVAFSKGGFDIRSRAAGGSCKNIVPKPIGSHCFDIDCSASTNALPCSSKTDDLGIKCCRWSLFTPRPTPTPIRRSPTMQVQKPTSTPTKSLQRIIISSPPRREPTLTPKGEPTIPPKGELTPPPQVH